VYWRSFQGVERPELDVDYSPPSSAEIKSQWSYTSIPHMLLKHGQNNFTSPPPLLPKVLILFTNVGTSQLKGILLSGILLAPFDHRYKNSVGLNFSKIKV
jgi:hypothetical protein